MSFREGGADERPGQVLAPEAVAGFEPTSQSNWTTIYASAEQGQSLLDDSGADSGATVVWGVSNAWGDGSVSEPGATPDETLARGNFDDGDSVDAAAGFGAADDGFGASIQVSGIPYDEYSVLLYLSSDYFDGEGAANGVFGDFTVNDATLSGGPTQGFASYGGWSVGNNLLVFTGQSSENLQIYAPARLDPARGSIAGFQIVEGFVVPEPGAIALAAIALVLLGAVRQRRNRV